MARLICSLKITLLLFLVLAPSLAKAEYTWGDNKYNSFSEFERAWDQKVVEEVNKEYDFFLLRKPTDQEIQQWLSDYKQNPQLSNKKKITDIYSEINGGQERKDYLTWRQEAKGVLLRANCSANDQEIITMAKDGKWKTENTTDKLGAVQKDCHYKASDTSSDKVISIIILALLLTIPLFTLIFWKKKWKIVAFLKNSFLAVYSVVLLLLIPTQYIAKGTSYVGMVFFAILGLFCLYHFVRVILKKRKSLFRKIARIVLSFFWIIPMGVILYFSSYIVVESAQTILPKPFIVDGASMEPTLKNNQFVTADKDIYKKEKPQRRDIVVFHRPVLEDKDNIKYTYIKRIVGLPTEKIEIKEGYLWINDVKQEETYLLEQGKTFIDFSITLRDNEYFALGDNRTHSGDSREFGPITLDDIIGKVKQ